jgi:hypothetical protein
MTLYELPQTVTCLVCHQPIEAGAATWQGIVRPRFGIRGYMHVACEEQEQEQQQQSQKQQGEGDAEAEDKPDGQGEKTRQKSKGESKQKPQQSGDSDQGEEQEPQKQQGNGKGSGQHQQRPDDDSEGYRPPFSNPASRPAQLEGTLIRRHFDSLDELGAYGLLKMKNSTNARIANEAVRNNSSSSGGIRWWGVEKYGQVYTMTRDGWPEGVDKMRKAFEAMGELLKPESIKRRFQWSDNGDEFDIHRAWSGHFDSAWRRMPKRLTQAPLHIKLICNTAENCSTDNETLFWRGAVCLYLADALTEAGYHVEVITAMGTAGVTSNYNCMLTTQVKMARAPLELNTLATALCLSGVMRVYGFLGWIKGCDDVGKVAYSNLGRATSYTSYCKLEYGEYEIRNVQNALDGKKEIERVIKLIQGETTRQGKAGAEIEIEIPF